MTMKKRAPRRIYELHWQDASGHVERLRTTLGRARALAQKLGREGWEEKSETWWLDIAILDARGERVDTVTVAIDPHEPACERGRRHRWEDAGMPGFGDVVCGHGGGAILRHVCAHCGLERATDTWAQRRDTGEQGLLSVSYKCVPPY